MMQAAVQTKGDFCHRFKRDHKFIGWFVIFTGVTCTTRLQSRICSKLVVILIRDHSQLNWAFLSLHIFTSSNLPVSECDMFILTG